MVQSRVATGLLLPTYPPYGDVRLLVSMARCFRLDSVCVYDHFQSLIPTSVWESVWWSTRTGSPHAIYEFQTLLGALAARAGRMQLGVAVTEPIRRHPVLIAQAAMTLAHLTKRPPILGLGSGERENTVPYGLDNAHAVDRLTEAVQIIRRCFSCTGPIEFEGKHFRLDGAVMDLQPPPGRTPQIWIAASHPLSAACAPCWTAACCASSACWPAPTCGTRQGPSIRSGPTSGPSTSFRSDMTEPPSTTRWPWCHRR
jgi:phthiodiolone/phenolphthiodiolone dimycocerosates ketoreductase